MPAAMTFRRMPLLPLFGLLLIVLTIAGGIWLSRAQAHANNMVRNALIVEMQIGEVMELTRTMESNHRGYLIAARASFREEMDLAAVRLLDSMRRLRAATRDDSRQQRAMDLLDGAIAEKIAFANAAADLVSQDRRGDAIRLVDVGRGQRLTARITQTLNSMKAIEAGLLNNRLHNVNRLIWWLVVGQSLALILIVIVAGLTIRDARLRSQAMEQARDGARAAADAASREMIARSEAEAQVRQLQKMESIGQLTGGIAHDFNNMLAIVIGSLDMASRRIGDSPEKLSRCIDNAREGAERAATLTARLLAFSRQQALAPAAMDANSLVAGMSDLLRRTLGEQVVVEIALTDGLWFVFADQSQLENAILNLAVNARDAMLSNTGKGGRLTITTRNLEDSEARPREDMEAGPYVVLGVGDTGAGMTPEVIERAFDPFFTTKEVGKGTGLGLSQVFGFVRQSGGHVSIQSEPGMGTIVELYLPRFDGPLSDTVDPVDPGSTPEGRADEIVLVVEDEPRVRHYSVDALRELGYTAISAKDGQDALALIRDNPGIALLFTDVVMPGMNGRALADEARALRSNLRILYTTGYTRNAVVHNGMLDAGVALLPKPFTIDQLARKVRSVIDNGGANRPA